MYLPNIDLNIFISFFFNFFCLYNQKFIRLRFLLSYNNSDKIF
jgi:hypothetical protein